MFGNNSSGRLVDIDGNDPAHGSWRHQAFVPESLRDLDPVISGATYRMVADARAALAALDSTSRRLPNPQLLRNPTLRTEAQSTSALEGTYAPLAEVLTADDEDPVTPDLREILNYVRMATHAFSWVSDGRPLTVPLLSDLQGILMQGSDLEGVSGRLRDRIVVIGRRPEADPRDVPVKQARFVPGPPGPDLEAHVRDLLAWMSSDLRDRHDPVVAAAMAHYQFETLHPFRDGNGRLGRLLIVLHLLHAQVLSEPTLTVSPWFEARRTDYYDALLSVSTEGDWDRYIAFFAEGLRHSAELTHRQMVALVDVQLRLHEIIRDSPLRAESAHQLVDLAVANPSFTVRRVEAELGVSYGRANALVAQLVDLGVLRCPDPEAYQRRFFAPTVLEALVRQS